MCIYSIFLFKIKRLYIVKRYGMNEEEKKTQYISLNSRNHTVNFETSK